MRQYVYYLPEIDNFIVTTDKVKGRYVIVPRMDLIHLDCYEVQYNSYFHVYLGVL